MPKLILLSALALFLITSCSGIKQFRDSPTIGGTQPVSRVCEVANLEAMCRIKFTQEGEDIKAILQTICLLLGDDSSKCVISLGDGTVEM